MAQKEASFNRFDFNFQLSSLTKPSLVLEGYRESMTSNGYEFLEQWFRKSLQLKLEFYRSILYCSAHQRLET